MLLEISREAFSIPIDLLLLLLLESNANAVEDRERESEEYIESVFRLLKAYPKTVITNCYMYIRLQPQASAFFTLYERHFLLTLYLASTSIFDRRGAGHVRMDAAWPYTLIVMGR
eukprot:scaffold44633_cov460-Skeletonema_marinoi.AAC.3